MVFDEGLAQRIDEHFTHRTDLVKKRMFGGLCYMLSDHMCCGIIADKLMARVGPAQYPIVLNEPYVTEMDFTGKPVNGIVYVLPEGLTEDTDLEHWLARCEAFAQSLPPKAPKPAKSSKR